MKKEEKTKLTRQKIIQAAIKEFGTKNYDNASLNTLCKEHHFSKGLIYHNFKNKDELYLECVRICYEAMKEHLHDIMGHHDHYHEGLKSFLKMRQSFFEEHPYYAHIFFNSVLLPPNHLINELKMIRQDYDGELRKGLYDLLSKARLRDGVSIEKAVNYVMVFQEMYNGYFRENSNLKTDLNSLILTHETKLTELLDIMLYGIVSEKELK